MEYERSRSRLVFFYQSWSRLQFNRIGTLALGTPVDPGIFPGSGGPGGPIRNYMPPQVTDFLYCNIVIPFFGLEYSNPLFLKFKVTTSVTDPIKFLFQSRSRIFFGFFTKSRAA